MDNKNKGDNNGLGVENPLFKIIKPGDNSQGVYTFS